MSEKAIPADVVLAAKRAFLRTTAQAYASTIPTGGVSAVVLAQVAADPWAFVWVGLAALLSPPLSGVSAYLNILGAGIPEDYQAR